MRDLHNNIKVVPAISPVAIGTTGTGQTSLAIDRQGYDSLEFIWAVGAVTSTAAVFTATVFEGATTGGAFTSVADANLLGTESAAGLGAAVRTDGTGDKIVRRIGYRGNQRYAKLKVSSTATAGPLISACAVLGNPAMAAVSNP